MNPQRSSVRELVIALTLATLAQTLISMAVYAPAVLAPAAQADIGLTATAIGIFTALIFVAAAYAAPLGGARVVRSGPVRVSQQCLLWAAGGMALFVSAVPAVIAAGALAIGMGYGPATPASSAMLSERTPDRLRNVIMSIRQSGVTLGGALAGALLPVLAVAYGWRAAALLVAVLCVAGAALLQIVRERYDAGRTGVRQAGHGSHLFLLRMVFRQAELRQGAFTSFTYAGAQMCFGSFLVVFLTERVGMSLIDAGAAYSAAMLSGIAGRMVWGALADYFDCARLVLGMLGLTMTLCAFVITLVSPQWPYAAVIALCMACGASAFGWNGVYIAEVARITSGENVALATGAVITFNFLGIVIAPVVFWLTVLLSGSYIPAFVLIGVMALAGSLPYFRKAWQ
ncbi:MAG: MFS transporter [Betaproteobacteria bacterium]|nr:MFS transporter [Betaproteobacteria bacterium]